MHHGNTKYLYLFLVHHSAFLFGAEAQLPDNLNLLADPGSLLRPVRFDHMNNWYLKRDPPLPTFTRTQTLSKSQEWSANQIWFVLLDWSLLKYSQKPSNPCCPKQMLPSPIMLQTLPHYTKVRVAALIWTQPVLTFLQPPEVAVDGQTVCITEQIRDVGINSDVWKQANTRTTWWMDLRSNPPFLT